ncbi:MAG TPA: GAF domain-containing protein, partial [Roseiflexaceae bacterium]|nr:GAF domain-containing protein [Roseiflexaceae bacterium]
CAAVARVDEDQLVYYISEHQGAEGAPLRAPLLPDSMAGQVVLRGTPLRVADFAAGTVFPPSPGLTAPRSELAVPVGGARPRAVLLVQSTSPNAFGDEDERQLIALSGLLAGALAGAAQLQAEQMRRRVAEAIHRLAQMISAAPPSGRIADLILDQLALVLPCDRSALLLTDGPRAELLAVRGWDPGQLRTIAALDEQPLLVALLAGGKPLALDDARSDPRYRPLVAALPARGWLGAPLMHQGRAAGLLLLESDQSHSYGVDAVQAVGAIAGQAAAALESARLSAAAQAHTLRLEVIAGITSTISNRDVSRELPSVLRTIIHQMRRIVPCDHAAVALVNPEEDTFTLETVYDASVRDWSRLPAGQRIPADQTPWQSACRTGSPVLQSDLAQSPFEHDRRLAEQGLRSGIVVPIIGQRRAFGALSFASQRTGVYSDVQIATLLELSLYLGPVLHNARLAHEREETAVKLARTQEHLNLVDKVRTVGQLASGVAHDFNNLLAAILGNAQLLQLEISDSDQLEMIQIIERAARDGTETVRRLQGFARMEHDSPMIEVRLDMLARDAIDITRPRWRDLAHSRGASITIERRLEAVVPIGGRPAELREVLTNLMINAVDAMPEGGTLTVKTYDDPVAGEVVVEVCDTGMGMPPEVRARVFDPFFTTKGEQGTGLGLAVSLGIVQSHGGQIEIDSEVGAGTRFCVRLPVRSAVYAAHQRARRELEIAPCHVLLVEGEEMIRTATARLLRRWGHQVTEATGGIEALQLFQPNTYDVVLSDLGMPDMNGWDLLAQLKRVDPDVPTVLITGWGRQYSADEARGRGADFVIEKPFDQETLREALAEALVRK